MSYPSPSRRSAIPCSTSEPSSGELPERVRAEVRIRLGDPAQGMSHVNACPTPMLWPGLTQDLGRNTQKQYFDHFTTQSTRAAERPKSVSDPCRCARHTVRRLRYVHSSRTVRTRYVLRSVLALRDNDNSRAITDFADTTCVQTETEGKARGCALPAVGRATVCTHTRLLACA